MKTPEQIAEEVIADADTETYFGRTITDWIVAAISADRAQPVRPDWEDDIENFRGSDRIDVEIAGIKLDANGKESVWFATDFELTEAQMVGMFRGIGRADA
jgi:hypothetical protein